MKKIMASVLAAAMIMGAGTATTFTGADTAITANAATEGTYGSMTYTMYDDYVKITDFDNSVSNLEIPAEIEGLPVEVIGENAFENATKLESVIIPNSITHIHSYAFYNCTLLNNITLPNSLNKIGSRVFQRCINLTEINLPDSITSIGYRAFSECVSLKEISFPNSILEIETEICSYCTSLSSVYIANGPNIIKGEAFAYCDSLKTVYIPISIQEVEYGLETSFSNCNALCDIYYNGTQSQWRVIDGINQFSGATIHYGAKEIPEPLTPDVNRDGAIDASDASCILAYYAYVMTGGKGTIEEFMAK